MARTAGPVAGVRSVSGRGREQAPLPGWLASARRHRDLSRRKSPGPAPCPLALPRRTGRFAGRERGAAISGPDRRVPVSPEIRVHSRRRVRRELLERLRRRGFMLQTARTELEARLPACQRCHPSRVEEWP